MSDASRFDPYLAEHSGRRYREAAEIQTGCARIVAWQETLDARAKAGCSDAPSFVKHAATASPAGPAPMTSVSVGCSMIRTGVFSHYPLRVYARHGAHEASNHTDATIAFGKPHVCLGILGRAAFSIVGLLSTAILGTIGSHHPESPAMNEPRSIAISFNDAYAKAWANAASGELANLYDEDAILVGYQIARGRGAIRDVLSSILAMGFYKIEISLIEARLEGGWVLSANEYVAHRSSGEALQAKSSHVLKFDGISWRTVMHTAT